MKKPKKKPVPPLEFWKIECLSCGVNCDLLINHHAKVICRECLNKYELKEVKDELEIYQDKDEQEESIYLRDIFE